MINTQYIETFLNKMEGNCSQAYVPIQNGAVIADSGVTVGRGVDLGKCSAKQLQNMAIPDQLIQKLSPYLGKTKNLALNTLNNLPLKLTTDELNCLNSAFLNHFINSTQLRFNTFGPTPFELSPKQVQAVCISLLYQYGINSCPSTFAKLAKKQTQAAINELLDPSAWGKKYYKYRRHAEAQLLKEIL